jgi:DNA topoisomerase-3
MNGFTNRKEDQEAGQFDEKSCAIVKLEILNKKTSSQKEFSQDTFLAFMESPRNKEEVKLIGLGTPATRSGIIKNLFDRLCSGGKKETLRHRQVCITSTGE